MNEERVGFKVKVNELIIPQSSESLRKWLIGVFGEDGYRRAIEITRQIGD